MTIWRRIPHDGFGATLRRGSALLALFVAFANPRVLAAPPPGSELELTSPTDYQVIQRTSKAGGMVSIRGEFKEPMAGTASLQARLTTEGKIGAWQELEGNFGQTTFETQIETPAGGWHRLEVRALNGDRQLGAAVVEHVGIGEIFVVAGQSNSGNHGAEKQYPKTGLVATFDGQNWRPANDPQPGASGNNGSFMPPFGDGIAEKCHVPVGLVACGVGATSVREWLPKGATFPNPPTLTGQVTQLPSGEWASHGAIFDAFTARMKTLGPRGFRAVLWHQGESDANQKDPTRTLPGTLYRDYLVQLIRDSRQVLGWNAPWFVAQASYHVPGDEASPDIRAAQASLWHDGIAFEGPDTDALKGDLRDSGGQGVHFSGPGLREHAARWIEKVSPWLEQQLK